jgi:hypothetical protein
MFLWIKIIILYNNLRIKIMSKIEESKKILYLNFNQDNTCISLGTDMGFIIYNISPFKEIYKRSKY